jgi:hypothetical protein
MQISSHRPARSTAPLSGSEAARQKIDQALQLLGQTRTENAELSDIYVAAEEGIEGYQPHVKAIEFDRPSKDVSE